MPEYVTATAALLGLIYPGHGVETSLRTDHVERMTFQDYIKVMRVSATPLRHTLSHISRGSNLRLQFTPPDVAQAQGGIMPLQVVYA